MDEIHTPAGYFIAIGAVLVATLLMPPFPWVFLLVPALLCCVILYFLGLAFYTHMRKIRAKTTTSFPGPGSCKPVQQRFR